MKKLLLILCAMLFTGACSEDVPTEVGAGLLPANSIASFEIVLGPERWLDYDTSFGLYSHPSDVDFGVLAREFDGVLNSRVLLQYDLPASMLVVDTLGVLSTDSMLVFLDGNIRTPVDTLASTAPPAVLSIHRTTEEWDWRTATWQLRIDSAGVQLPWTQPGGSPGALISTATYLVGDTVELPVDSATLNAWADSEDTSRGALMDVTTSGARLITGLPSLHVNVQPSSNPDTVIGIVLTPRATFIFDPEQPASVAEPRVGGTPAWRTIMQMRERLDTVVVPCPGVPGCMTRLGHVSINFAAVVLQPVPAPPGFAPEVPINIAVHALLPSPLVPIERSPLTPAVGGSMGAIPTSSFTVAGAPTIDLIATDFLRAAFAPPSPSETVRPSHLALLQSGFPRTFGFGTFQSMPSLRIVASFSSGVQLP